VDLWNRAIRHRPARVVTPKTADEVSRAIVGRGDLPVSVRSGGHDWAGRSVRDGGLVLDIRGLDHVRVDTSRRIAAIGGGASSHRVAAETGAHGLLAAAGNVGSVGFAGLTLGGGYGPLSGRFGLALDNLVGAQVVLGDGRIVDTDADREPELFWAIRGGGGNFGVVTELRVAVHPVDQLLVGVCFFAWDDAEQLLPRLAARASAAPEALTTQLGILSTPAGTPGLFALTVWSGDFDEGAAEIDAFMALGDASGKQVAPMSYADLMSLYESFLATDIHVSMRTRSVAEITPDVARALVRAGETRTSPLSGIPINHLRGPGARVPVQDTAFANRTEHFVIEIASAWTPDMPGAHDDWATAVWADLEPLSLPGGYVNLIGPEQTAQSDAAYGSSTERLLGAKRAFDPTGVFAATPLPTPRDS
jgi:FAD/FMN-containing dehydrogenase